MSGAPDVIIVGSGPAGVSAAFPLLEAGLRVLMVDGGREPALQPPALDFLSAREKEADQWRWMLGPDFHALRMREAVSPKFRAAPQAFAFHGFTEANRIVADRLVAAGSLAAGGLSNAWGCGVARFTEEEARLPFPIGEMAHSYAVVSRRMGLSGAVDDDLSSYFGLDDWAQPPLALDAAQQRILQHYDSKRESLRHRGFRLGRSRVAVPSQEGGPRAPCDFSGNCLFGCSRGSLYSAAQDLFALSRHHAFSREAGVVVDRLEDVGSGWVVHGRRDQQAFSVGAARVVVAAGTLATTAIVARSLQYREPMRLLTSPSSAFLLWVPALLGQPRRRGFGLGQLSFTVALPPGRAAFGSLFATTGLPLWEFARHLPLGRAVGMQVLRHLLSSCVVGNVFLSGDHSNAQAQLRENGELLVTGHPADAADAAFGRVKRELSGVWRRLGGWMLPGSFTIGQPGGDLHYAGTLPMSATPRSGQTGPDGGVYGLRNVYVVDGAALPALPEKSHTLTIMANADRIGRHIASEVK